MLDEIQERNKVAIGHDFKSAKNGFEYLYSKRRIEGQMDTVLLENVEGEDACVIMEKSTTTLKKNGVQRIIPAENKHYVIQWLHDLYLK